LDEHQIRGGGAGLREDVRPVYQGDFLFYSFSLYHGLRIRVRAAACGNFQLSSASREELSRWLAERGVVKKLAEYEALARN